MFKKVVFVVCLSPLLSFGSTDGAALSKQYGLVPGTKASIQWKRIFKSERKLKKYGLHQLSHEELVQLKQYLIDHAADSPKPIVPGL